MSALLGITKRDGVTRRDAIKLLATAVAAVQASCYQHPGDEVVAAAVDDRPELHAQTTADTTRYATALALGGFAAGVIAECHGGWPTKLDGNPAHPATRGGSTAILQARVLDLYDPQRERGTRAAWASVASTLAAPRGPVWIVMSPQSSPAIAGLLAAIAARAELHVVWDEPIAHAAAYAGARLAYGRAVEAQLDPARCDLVAALDADWLAAMPMAPAWGRAMATRRAPGTAMSRLWAAEPMPTPTGTLADERLAIRAGDVACVATVIAAAAAPGLGLPADLVARARGRLSAPAASWADRLAAELLAHRGAGGIVVGDRQPAVVHALARWIDHACGNAAVVEPARLDAAAPGESLAELAAALEGGRVDTLLVLDANPLATAPTLAPLLSRARVAVAVTAWDDETARALPTAVRLAHELEAWSDPRAWDGTRAIAQPVVRPRFEVVSPLEVLAALAGDARAPLAIVRAASGLDDAGWRAALAHGVIAGSAAPPIAPELAAPAPLIAELARVLAADAPAFELALAASPLHDGRFAGNAWLQELPHPITKQMWGNAALLGPATAAALGVETGGSLELQTAAGALALPALIVPGHVERAITVELGHGRAAPGLPVADGSGGDGYRLRGAGGLITAVTARAAGGARPVILAQLTLSQHDRPIAPSATVAELRRDPDLAAALRGPSPSLLPETQASMVPAALQWAMSIDTSLCTGCNACVVACQAENNTPTVGPEHAARGRRMHWLRIDTYVDAGDAYVHQPVPCMHCEHAPCEYVCPVGATEHSPDGLNEQVYNRCVGTRFCSNNCPYKVRRFNWFSFERPTSTRALQHNPDVTVRSRGVMEKCTYCVQRIRGAEHVALVEHRAIRPGEVVTACQAACPTQAIAFGALAHAGPLAQRREDPRRYELLHHLGTRPRTQHLVRVRNPQEHADE